MCRNARALHGIVGVRPAPPASAVDPRPAERGFNLIELLMAMALSTIIFMAITSLYAAQGESIASQAHLLDSSRSGRFAMEHLRRDLLALGSNATPNSAIDDLVCPKPAVHLRALTVRRDLGYIYRGDLNPHLRTVAMTLFGSLDVKSRYETAAITGKIVTLLDDGGLPATQALWDATFTTDRYLRLATADGKSMMLPIAGTSFGSKTVTVTDDIPALGGAQRCGYQGTGSGLTVDVQGFIRYRIIGDERPTAARDASGVATDTLLVRERLEADGTTVRGALPLAANVVEIALYDAHMDGNPAEDTVTPELYYTVDEMVAQDGSGVLGNTLAARPEALRTITVKVSLRAARPLRGLSHRPRGYKTNPLFTYRISPDVDGVCQVTTMAARVTLPTLVSRNL